MDGLRDGGGRDGVRDREEGREGDHSPCGSRQVSFP